MLHGKVITIKRDVSYLCLYFDKQLARYLQVSYLRVVICVGCAFFRSVTIFDLRRIRHLIRLNNDLINK